MGGMIAYALLMGPVQQKIASAVTLGSPTMSHVGDPFLDFGVPYRWLLRYLPRRVPIGTLARLGAPLAPLLATLPSRSIAELGWSRGMPTSDCCAPSCSLPSTTCPRLCSASSHAGTTPNAWSIATTCSTSPSNWNGSPRRFASSPAVLTS